MNWANSFPTKPIQQDIPFEKENISNLGRQIIDALVEKGDMRLPQIADAIKSFDLSAIIEELLRLKMDCKIRTCPGGV